MIPKIVTVAMAEVEGNPDYKIDPIYEWGAHLRPLIADHTYDFSLIWFRPSCDVVRCVGDGSKFRRNNLAWPEPLFEQFLGFYTRMTNPEPGSYADYVSKNSAARRAMRRLCLWRKGWCRRPPDSTTLAARRAIA